jgi:small subunit ribosomal protein S16e
MRSLFPPPPRAHLTSPARPPARSPPSRQALCKAGKGHIRLNGSPLHLAEPAILRIKILEPILLLGRDKFAGVDMRIRCTGGGFSSQVYAIRQAIAKSMVAYTQKCE